MAEWFFGSYTAITEAEEAMKIAYCKMFHVKQVKRLDRFNVDVESGGFLTLDCPGNACGINPDTNYQEGEMGYKLSCHNVNTPM